MPWSSTWMSHKGVFWNQLKSENIESSYLLSNWKNQCRLTIKKHALLWNKHEHQFSADIWENPFHDIVSFYTPWNTSENQSFPDEFLCKSLNIIYTTEKLLDFISCSTEFWLLYSNRFWEVTKPQSGKLSQVSQVYVR